MVTRMSVAEHASFAPSSISRIIQCPGSWKLCKKYPGIVQDGTREAALEGQAAHWVAAVTAIGYRTGLSIPKVGDIHLPTGIAITEEMLDGAELYAETVGDDPQHVEERIPPSEEFGPDCWGTPDVWNWSPNTMVLRIDDYKFGHRFVDVFENWQLVCYACLIIDGVLKLDGMQDQCTLVEFRIIQPRNFHPDGPVRSWTCKASDLRPLRNQIKAAIAKAQRDDAEYVVGPECRDCSARAYCGALQRASMSAIEESRRVTPMELPPGALGLELRMLNWAADLIRARQAGLREVAMDTVKRGVMVPGFRLETGKGRERWKVPVADIVGLEAVVGVKLTEPKAITPKQAVKAGVAAEIVAAFSETPNGETKLVEDDGSLTRRIFGGV